MWVVDDEQELVRTLEAMRTIWIGASGTSHGHLDALLDPGLRHSPSTRNYLASGASGTLRDRVFDPSNGDRISHADAASTNDGYRRLLDAAILLNIRLNLQATGDWS
jgi:hypothetical protein